MEERARDQPRLGVEGPGGTTMPGHIFKRANFRVYFVGGMAALGLAWFLTSVRPFSSKLEPVTSKAAQLSRGSRMPTVPTEPSKNQDEHPEGPTLKVKPKTPAHTGFGEGHSEGSKTSF